VLPYLKKEADPDTETSFKKFRQGKKLKKEIALLSDKIIYMGVKLGRSQWGRYRD
jgi:hypothetical protein